MNDKELKLIESIRSESRSSAEVKVKRAIAQFVNDIGIAKVNGKSLKEIVLELDSEQIINSLADTLYEQTLDIESSAYQRNSNTPTKTIKNVQVQINGELFTHISASSEEEALADLMVKSRLGGRRIVKTVIVQGKLVNLITE